MKDSWPQPPSATCSSDKPLASQLLPIFPAPHPESLPSLPSPYRRPIFDAPYTLSTHIFPATHLRTTEYVEPPPPLSTNASKVERQTYADAAVQNLKSLRAAWKPQGTKQVLWNCVNRYVRVGLDEKRSNGITLLFLHACGFPKEIWEPVLQHLLSSSTASLIDEVWSWESVHHGDASLINADKNGGIFDWTTEARDILNFLNFFLPSKASDSPLPTHLARVPVAESEYRQSNPFRHRRLAAIGHSFGGTTLTLGGLTQPNLFSSILLVDPWINKQQDLLHESTYVHNLAKVSAVRRETWDSREEALVALRRSPFFSTWDPAALKIFVECGTYDTIDPVTGQSIIRLKMSGMQEAVTHCETHTPYEVFSRLHTLDERIELRWVVPGRPDAPELGPPGSTRERVWLRPKNASNIRIPDTGHFIAQEAPQLLARDIQRFLQRQYNYRQANL